MTSPHRNKPASVLLLAFYFLLFTFYFLGVAFGDAAQVGKLFATGRPEDLKALNLLDEANRLVAIGMPRQAEDLIYQTLKLYPLHPEAFEAVDFLVQQVSQDRSVPDQDRADACRQVCLLGVRTAQAWVDHYRTGEEAARADFKRIEYQFKSVEGSPDASVRYARELTTFLTRYNDSSLVGQAALRLSEFLVDTGQFQRVIDLQQELASRRGHVPTHLLGRAYYETGDFEKAVRSMAGEGWGTGRSRVREWRDSLARLRFYMGDTRSGMDLIDRGALVRRSNVFVDVEYGWQDIPSFRKLERDFQLPEGADWAADVNYLLRIFFVADAPDLVDGTPVIAYTGESPTYAEGRLTSVALNMTLRLDPIIVPGPKTDCTLTVLTPIEIETSVPYGATSADTAGFRTTWPLELAPTPDDYVNAPRLWARSCAGVLRNPPCRIWRTCTLLDNNRVQVDVYITALADSEITIDNPRALIEQQPVNLPESAQVQGNRTIRMQLPAAPALPDSRRPDKPLCSYVVRCFQNPKLYLPAVTVTQRVRPSIDTAQMPPALKWRWDLAGCTLEIASPRKFALRKVSLSGNFTYQLKERLEAAP